MATVKLDSSLSCARPEWCDKPGLWDPLSVVQVCIPLLTKEVYPDIKIIHRNRIAEYGSEAPQLHNKMCKGVRMYLEAWKTDDEVEKVVRHYICFPCKLDLVEYIKGLPERALLLLLTYLRYRGPFIHWKFRVDHGIPAFKCLEVQATGYLKALPDIDFGAAIYIGRHLNYLVNVATGQGLYYIKDIIAKVWGPLFLAIVYDHSIPACKQMLEVDKVNLSIQIFNRMLNSVAWDKLEPFQILHHNMKQDDLRRMIRYNQLENENHLKHLKIPEFLAENITTQMQNMFNSRAEFIQSHPRDVHDPSNVVNPELETITCACKKSLEKVCSQMAEGHNVRLPSDNPVNPYLPEYCRLNFGR